MFPPEIIAAAQAAQRVYPVVPASAMERGATSNWDMIGNAAVNAWVAGQTGNGC
jgi:hypothetical protein